MPDSPPPVFQRRRVDPAARTARNLNWSTRPSDILLHPHSPLAIADVLSRVGGCFDLIAADVTTEYGSENETASTDRSAPVAPPTHRARPRRARDRMNLLTQHPSDELQKRCRALTVENALIKQRSDQHLYLAAGFIVADGIRAPALLYPALLVHKPNKAGHEVRMSDTEPDHNQRAFKTIGQRFGVALPLRSEAEALSDYFARLAAAITPINGMDFAFDVALGNASPDFLFTPSKTGSLPDVPEEFDITLAMTLATDISLDELHTMLRLIPDVVPPQTTVGDSVVALSGIAANHAGIPQNITKLRDFAVKLATRGLDHMVFDDLPALADRIDNWLSNILISRKSETAAEVFSVLDLSVAQLAQLGNIMELIDKAPQEIDTAAHTDLAYASTGVLLRRAQHQAQLIQEEFESLQQHFVMELIPSKTELLQLIDELERGAQYTPSSNSEVVDAEYFHARRRFMDFSREKPAHIEDEHRRRLIQLAKVLRFRELFVNNTEYRQSLGTHYRGLRTDWARLTRMVDFARELGDVLGSESMAALAIADFPRFRQALIADLDKLRSGNEALREATAVFGRQWDTQSVESFCNNMAETTSRLHEWRLNFGDLVQGNLQTPAQVLSQFTGNTSHDAETVRRLRAAKAYIDDTLRSGRSDASVVAGTLDWLRSASQHASERQLDIGAIVDHLQIA